MSAFKGTTTVRVLVCALGLVAATALAPPAARAADTVWQVATDTWFDGNNWDNGVPNNTKNAVINNSGTAQIHVNSPASALGLFVGYDTGNSGNVSQTDGTLAVTNILGIGYLAGSSGEYSLSGTGQVSSAILYVGSLGDGTFTQSGGLNSATTLYLGSSSGASGLYTLSSGSLTTTDSYVGDDGTGTFTHSGGKHTVNNTLYICYSCPSTCAYTLSGTGNLDVKDDLYVCYNGSGTFTQTSGISTVADNLWLASMAGSTATFKITNGTCTIGGDILANRASATSKLIIDGGGLSVGGVDIQANTFTIAEAGGSNGSFTFSTGQFLAADTEYIGKSGTGALTQNGVSNNWCDDLYLGYDSSGSGTYEMTGGTVRVDDTEYIGRYGAGSLTQSGGVHTPWCNLYLGYYSGSSGDYTLSGTGRLDAKQNAYIGRRGNGTFTQNGGICQVTGSLYIARYSEADNSNYNMSGGTLNVSGTALYVGYGGTGTFTQSGGINTVANDLYIAYASGSNGTYNLSGTGSLSATTIHVGYSGTGQFNFTGGTLDADTINVEASGYMKVEQSWEYDGALNINNGMVDVMDGMGTHYDLTLDAPGAGATCTMTGWPRLETGNNTIGKTGKATFTHNGGAHQVVGLLQLGQAVGGEGIYTLADGCLNVQGSERIGYWGTGSVTHTGGMHTIDDTLCLGCMPGSSGTYDLSEAAPETPSDLHAQTEFIGDYGTGIFTQSGGHHGAETLYIAHQSGSTGTYTLSGGGFDALDFYIGTGGSGTFDITNAAVVIYVANLLHFGPNSTFSAVAGSTIHMIGSALENESIDPTATGLAGLGNMSLIFQGGTADVDPVEVAGEDKGAAAAGWTDNFALDTLTLGTGDEFMEGRISLVDNSDNQPGWEGDEALYVNNLILNAGATIDLNGLNLYYDSGDPKQFFCGDADLDGGVDDADLSLLLASFGDTGKVWGNGDFDGDGDVDDSDLSILLVNFGSVTGPSAVPEPASASLLLLGAVVLLRRRKR